MDLGQKLKNAITELEQKRTAAKHLKVVQADLEKAFQELETHEQLASKEYREYRDLEKMGLRRLFGTVLGNREQQLERERQEHLEAVLGLKKCKQEVELLEFEVGVLEGKVDGLVELQKEVQKLMSAREKAIVKGTENKALRRQILDLTSDIDQLVRQFVEAREAYKAGVNAEKILVEMRAYLRKSAEWGWWDDSRKVKYVQQTNIDRAYRLSGKATQLLRKFDRELRDVFPRQELRHSFQLFNFRQFDKSFYMNLIFDWIIREKVKNALHNVESVLDQVQHYLRTLKRYLEITDETRVAAEKQKKELILLSIK